MNIIKMCQLNISVFYNLLLNIEIKIGEYYVDNRLSGM